MNRAPFYAKVWAIGWTAIYGVLFVLTLLGINWFLIMLCYRINSLQLILPTALAGIFLPFSFSLSIERMWSNYLAGRYGRVVIAWCIPGFYGLILWLYVFLFSEAIS